MDNKSCEFCGAKYPDLEKHFYFCDTLNTGSLCPYCKKFFSADSDRKLHMTFCAPSKNIIDGIDNNNNSLNENNYYDRFSIKDDVEGKITIFPCDYSQLTEDDVGKDVYETLKQWEDKIIPYLFLNRTGDYELLDIYNAISSIKIKNWKLQDLVIQEFFFDVFIEIQPEDSKDNAYISVNNSAKFLELLFECFANLKKEAKINFCTFIFENIEIIRLLRNNEVLSLIYKNLFKFKNFQKNVLDLINHQNCFEILSHFCKESSDEEKEIKTQLIKYIQENFSSLIQISEGCKQFKIPNNIVLEITSYVSKKNIAQNNASKSKNESEDFVFEIDEPD